MRKLWLPSLLLIISSLFFNSCKKNYAEEKYTEIINPVIPDFTTKVNAAVTGFVTDENGKAVEGATIKAGIVTVVTDKYGYFKISNAAFAKTAGFVQITKGGYFTGYRSFFPAEGKENFIRLQLIPKKTAGSINAATGGTVTTADGAKITLPADAVVVASSNTVYTGTVNVAAHWLNPSQTQTTNLTMPGDLRGIDSAGHLKALVTYGMLAVELTGDGGELLQVANGKKAILNFPIPSSINTTAPGNIVLWSFDESKGLWKQDGHAVKNGSEYIGEVSHFSFWNCDVGMDLVNFSVQLVDASLRPLANIEVSVSIAGQPGSARWDYTDTSGYVQGMVPANSNLQLELVNPCNTINTIIRSFTTTTGGIQLGTLKTSTDEFIATIKGSVKRCNGSAVTNGAVFITAGAVYRAPVNTEGNFDFPILLCSNTEAQFTAVDLDSLKQSQPVASVLAKGINNIGTISACENVTQFISFGVYAGPPEAEGFYTAPLYLLTAGYNIASGQTIISAKDQVNNLTVFTMQVTIPTEPGTYPLEIGAPTNAVFPYPFTYYFGRNTVDGGNCKITITEYGLIGQFIKGYINEQSYVNSQPTQASFLYTCSFAVKRSF